MADYYQYIGGSTTLLIRDTGGWVEFWIQTGPQTWNNDQRYSFGANGVGSGIREFRLLRGGYWQFIDSVWVGYDQTISFTIYGAGLGFPTYTFYQYIPRSTVPQAPTLNSVVGYSQSGYQVIFTYNHDGGSAVVERQLGYGSSTNGPSYLTPLFDNDEIVGGFSAGQRYYFWVRVRNSLGWSPWSNRKEATTWQVPAAPGPATFWNVTQKSVGVTFPFAVRPTDPPNIEREIAYGRDPTGVVKDGTITADETTEYFYNLQPGGTYYFWGRARNSVGWGPWSASSKVNLIAGARVLVEGSWKRAVPYVNVGGIWKVAEPWSKDAGVWKKTTL
jgi:hypothetical protein